MFAAAVAWYVASSASAILIGLTVLGVGATKAAKHGRFRHLGTIVIGLALLGIGLVLAMWAIRYGYFSS